MQFFAPRTCQIIGVVTLAGVVAVDAWGLVRRRMPNPHLHNTALTVAGVFGVAGLVGAYLDDAVLLGRRLDHTRQRHTGTGATVTVLPTRPGHQRPGQDT